MGSVTKGFCKCGYISEDIHVGGGMDTYTMISYFPCLCVDCEEIIEVNILEGAFKKIDFSRFEMNDPINEKNDYIPLKDRVFRCEKCKGQNVIIYNDERLIGDEGDGNVISWGDNYLTNGSYYCPICKEMLLKFMPSFKNWD